MDAEKSKFLTDLVEYPEETTLTEYKSALPFDSKTDFGIKLVKHILGLANAGGGYIVIGFQEDSNRKLVPDPNMIDLVGRSYETTSLSQSVDSYLSPGQRIELQVHKVEHKGKTFPVISIQGFNDSPYFCGKECLGSNSKPLLREGAIYVRDPAVKTVVIAGPEHWNVILRRAVTQKQTEMVDQLRSLLEQLGLSALTPKSAEPPVQDLSWFSSESQKARSILKELAPQGGIFELHHYPVGVSTTWNQAELVAAAEKSVVRKTGWPMGFVSHNPDFSPKPTNHGVRA